METGVNSSSTISLFTGDTNLLSAGLYREYNEKLQGICMAVVRLSTDLRKASSLDGQCHAELVLQSRILLPAVCQFLLQLCLPVSLSLFH